MSGDSDPLQRRLESLECKLMDLERGHEQLNAVVVSQARTVERLAQQVEALGERLRELLEDRAQ